MRDLQLNTAALAKFNCSTRQNLALIYAVTLRRVKFKFIEVFSWDCNFNL